jgi:hypothetical protein
MSPRLASVDAVVDSVVKATLSTAARGQPVRGQYVVLRTEGDLILGPVHADDAFAPYIMSHGSVPEWSKEVDIERAEIEVVGVVEETSGRKVEMRRNPSSGTPVTAATADDIALFANEREHVLVLGTIPNSGGLPATIVNRHHGAMEDGGYGEARHTAVYGQTGGGKTVMASMLIAGKLAAHRDMGLLMPDTAGDLSDPSRHSRGGFRWNYGEALAAAGVTLEIIEIGDVKLSSKRVLAELLKPVLTRQFALGGDKQETLAERVCDAICDSEVTPDAIATSGIMAAMLRWIPLVYSGSTGNAKLATAQAVSGDPDWQRQFGRELDRVRKFFDGRHDLRDLIKGVLRYGRKVIIRMDDSTGLLSHEQEYVMREVMDTLKSRARVEFHAAVERSANALVVLDEGTRWVPERGGSAASTGIGQTIEEAFRETRKYGLGWMVIAQRPSDVAKTVLTQSHTKWFGRGLAVGNDMEHLKNHLGASGLETYQRLAKDSDYFWVGVGQDTNVGATGAHFALRPFDGDATRAFVAANPSIFSGGGL